MKDSVLVELKTLHYKLQVCLEDFSPMHAQLCKHTAASHPLPYFHIFSLPELVSLNLII